MGLIIKNGVEYGGGGGSAQSLPTRLRLSAEGIIGIDDMDFYFELPNDLDLTDKLMVFNADLYYGPTGSSSYLGSFTLDKSFLYDQSISGITIGGLNNSTITFKFTELADLVENEDYYSFTISCNNLTGGEARYVCRLSLWIFEGDTITN